MVGNVPTVVGKICEMKAYDGTLLILYLILRPGGKHPEALRMTSFRGSFYADMCVVLWTEGLTVTIKWRFQIHPA